MDHLIEASYHDLKHDLAHEIDHHYHNGEGEFQLDSYFTEDRDHQFVDQAGLVQEGTFSHQNDLS